MFPTDGRGSTSWDKCPCGRIPHTRRILGQPARAIGACPCIHCTCRGSSMSPCYRALLSSSRGRHVGPTVLEPGYRLSLQYHLLTLAGDNDASRRPCGHLSHRLPASYGRRSQFRDERRGNSEEQRGFEQAGHRAVHSDGNKARSARRTVFDTFQIISIKASDC